MILPSPWLPHAATFSATSRPAAASAARARARRAVASRVRRSAICFPRARLRLPSRRAGGVRLLSHLAQLRVLRLPRASPRVRSEARPDPTLRGALGRRRPALARGRAVERGRGRGERERRGGGWGVARHEQRFRQRRARGVRSGRSRCGSAWPSPRSCIPSRSGSCVGTSRPWPRSCGGSSACPPRSGRCSPCPHRHDHLPRGESRRQLPHLRPRRVSASAAPSSPTPAAASWASSSSRSSPSPAARRCSPSSPRASTAASSSTASSPTPRRSSAASSAPSRTCVFWGLQVAIASVGPDKRLMWCARLALLAVGRPRVQDGGRGHRGRGRVRRRAARGDPPGVLATRRVDHRRLVHALGDAAGLRQARGERAAFLKAQATWLPVLAGAAAIAGAGVSSAPAPWSASRSSSRRAW